MKKFALIAAVLMVGVLAASAGTLGVAQFNDPNNVTDPATLLPTTAGNASFITLKNNDGVTNTYTVLYFTLQGVSRTPAANTFTIAANASRVWRPVQTDTSEGTGSTIPNATGAGGAGTASILYTDTNAPSGRVLTTVGVVNLAYSWSMIP